MSLSFASVFSGFGSVFQRVPRPLPEGFISNFINNSIQKGKRLHENKKNQKNFLQTDFDVPMMWGEWILRRKKDGVVHPFGFVFRFQRLGVPVGLQAFLLQLFFCFSQFFHECIKLCSSLVCKFFYFIAAGKDLRLKCMNFTFTSGESGNRICEIFLSGIIRCSRLAHSSSSRMTIANMNELERLQEIFSKVLYFREFMSYFREFLYFTQILTCRKSWACRKCGAGGFCSTFTSAPIPHFSEHAGLPHKTQPADVYPAPVDIDP